MAGSLFPSDRTWRDGPAPEGMSGRSRRVSGKRESARLCQGCLPVPARKRREMGATGGEPKPDYGRKPLISNKYAWLQARLTLDEP